MLTLTDSEWCDALVNETVTLTTSCLHDVIKKKRAIMSSASTMCLVCFGNRSNFAKMSDQL